jgi:hypothetical protein
MPTRIPLITCTLGAPRAIALVVTLACLAPAHAGWFQVRTYAGKIGDAPVHLALQRYDRLGAGDDSSLLVEGSYYYDAHRKPIPLTGKRAPDGTLRLCEATAPRSQGDSLVVPPASPAHPVPCAITLTLGAGDAAGKWNDGKRVLPIALAEVGSLDDTDEPILSGVVEIPMWHHTGKHLLLGIYEADADCPVSMLRLRLVDIASGRIDRDIPLDCDAGMIMTSIFANVSASRAKNHVTVGFQGGKMGRDEEIDLGRAGRK